MSAQVRTTASTSYNVSSGAKDHLTELCPLKTWGPGRYVVHVSKGRMPWQSVEQCRTQMEAA